MKGMTGGFRLLPLLLAALLLLSCGMSPVPAEPSGLADSPSTSLPGPGESAQSAREQSEAEPVPTEPEDAGPAPYVRPAGLSPEEVVEAYLAESYRSYVELADTGITAFLDMSTHLCRSLDLWMTMLHMRRKLLLEFELCYVEQEVFPYEVTFLDEEEVADERVSFWAQHYEYGEDEVMLHFTVTGEPGKAYPPLLAVNSQHTVRLRPIDGEWHIVFHFFPGSLRRFATGGGRHTLLTEEEMLEGLLEEFASLEKDAPLIEVPESAALYDGDLAADYALTYTESPNPAFYDIGDWIGNCANFTSQCVWAGFGGEDTTGIMSNAWYAGDGGGSPAWENVGYFWDYAVTEGGIGGQVLAGINACQAGDLIQTSYYYNNWDANRERAGGVRYNHSLLVVDEDTLLLAQHSPANYIYYSDILLVDTRIFRPRYVD